MKAICLSLALSVSAAVCLNLNAQAAEAVKPPPSEEKLVLCWYMVCFYNTVEFYKQEIEIAQRHGIDGFLLDVGVWGSYDEKTGEFKPDNYVEATARFYEAAKQLGTGFKLAMAPEYSIDRKNSPAAKILAEMVRRYHDHPNQLRRNGKTLITAYGVKAPFFSEAIRALKEEGIELSVVPHLFLPRHQYLATPEQIYKDYAEAPFYDGIMNFQAVPINEIIRDNSVKCRVSHKLGKIFGAGVIPAYNSANLEDFRGLKGYGALWEGAIRDGADWISIIIWNDYNEDSNLMHFRWPAGSQKAYFDRDGSFLDATAYYSAWFKSGRRPEISQDKFFITYRNRSKWLRQTWDGKAEKWLDLTKVSRNANGLPFDQIHDNVEDNIYLDSFLTAPATLEVRVGGIEKTFQMPAGVGHAELPLVPGVPHLVLKRGNDTLADVIARKLIIGEATKENSPAGYHLLNRTWASGTAIGPAVRIEAESGELLGGAELVKVGDVQAVQTKAAEGSGVKMPVKGLKTSMYNVRIRYCNPSDTEARLTLVADGPPRGEKEYPYFIPAFLPPTWKDRFDTVSFFWNLYEGTSFLKIAWEQGKMFSKLEPSMDDIGSAVLDSVELVLVEPVKVPARNDSIFPEMLPIPGGEFTMGGEGGEPDELPAHKVSVSPFAIGKFEVTNDEFENFDPPHRDFRNEISWRGCEPVIAVSWFDAVKYCNWLSDKAGLKPAYSEVDDPTTKGKIWVVDTNAEGFRLPTEAEWEYVASGRGEGRKYPWGNDEPVPQKHGNFMGRAALDFDSPSLLVSPGRVAPVGLYPAGASRDGVMDMAGNVGEWCSDWYNLYKADAQTDPCGSDPENYSYRSIRGGTWGWYNISQRCRDREFNSPGYPGHCYYGFRLAISEAGWKKIGKGGGK